MCTKWMDRVGTWAADNIIVSRRMRRISRNWQCMSSPKSVSIPLTCEKTTDNLILLEVTGILYLNNKSDHTILILLVFMGPQKNANKRKHFLWNCFGENNQTSFRQHIIILQSTPSLKHLYYCPKVSKEYKLCVQRSELSNR